MDLCRGALFLGFNQRRRSRWSKMGGGGLYTSPGAEQSFIETLASQGDDWDESIMVFRTTTWEAKGRVGAGRARLPVRPACRRHPDRARGRHLPGVDRRRKHGIGELPTGEEVRWRIGSRAV